MNGRSSSSTLATLKQRARVARHKSYNNLRNCEMAVNVLKASLPRLPDKPHHPQNFSLTKQMFGKTRPVMCSAQSQWFTTWPFLHYVEAQDVVFCHTCVTTVKLDRIKPSNNAANAFVSANLRLMNLSINIPVPSMHCLLGSMTNLDSCLNVFRSERVSATGKMQLLASRSISSPSVMLKQLKLLWFFRKPQRMSVHEQLSRAHQAEKEQARDMLQLILSSVRFLARQGLALRGDGSDASANLIQLLCLRAEDKPCVL